MGRQPEGKAEKMFKRFGKNVDSILSDFKESERFAKMNVNQRISTLNKDVETLESHLSSVSENAKTHWEEAKPNLERAGQELRKAMQTLFTKRAYRQ